MFTEVVKAEYVDGFRVRLWFNNKVTKVVDLRTSLQGKVFEPLKDLNFFKRFTVKYNTIEWENGADFAPEYLLSLPEALGIFPSHYQDICCFDYETVTVILRQRSGGCGEWGTGPRRRARQGLSEPGTSSSS